MRMETSLSQKQVMQLRLAPQILQRIEVLQLATLDLKGLVEREMEMNPTIEIETQDPVSTPSADDLSPVGDSKTLEDNDAGVPTDDQLIAEFDRLENLNEEWKDFSPSFRGSGGGGGEKDKKLEAMNNTADTRESLQEVLERQLHMLNIKERDAKICSYLVWNIDDNGYMRFEINEEFAKEIDVTPPATPADVEDCLELIQTLEPAGIGARDLRECLLLQLESTNTKYKYDLEIEIVRDHLDDVMANRLPKIAKAVNEPIEVIHEAVIFIRSLNPKPGLVFSNSQVHYVVPDVVVDKIDGKYEVRVEDSYIPKISISRHYVDMLQAGADDPKVRAYVKKKIESAKWLMESIEQRKSTLSRIAQEIVDFQTPFLDKGLDSLRPLKMQFIADKVGVHVSTVSRAISEKYMQTPRGIFALRYFFNGGTTSADGEETSIVSVKQKVREIIDQEDKQHPLSDEEIAAALKQQGLEIARRTVTKYRKQLGIPSSRQRRSYV
ncbi:MAG: RNA polymerase factor sigma-54 [Planctomycetes bacterium]|nr:RNA polymerase factor sigma-54 [Planctomycetota bacterium]